MKSRPFFHFTPEKGWCNDPNGTIYLNGTYHLFYQYYPDDIVWGPMHWGHAVSKDLAIWEHRHIALCPDNLGYIFSGSCIYDEENVSGLGTQSNPPLIAMYTSHDPDTGVEQQSIAFSTDFENFTKYENNPVISNQIASPDYKPDFRDPKLFRNTVKGGYSIALAAGKVIEFYHSDDLINWQKTGEFYPGENGFSGVCECPDCFPMKIAGEEKWVLLLSSILDDDKINGTLEERGYAYAHVMQYFIGDFDGDTFIDTQKSDVPLVPDYGPDNYAMVSFANCTERLLIGWGENWDYVSCTPAADYRGKMTLVRRADMVETSRGYRLSFEPCADVKKEKYIMQCGDTLVLRDDNADVLKIKVTEDEIWVDRSRFGDMCFSEKLKNNRYNISKAKRYKSGDCDITVVRDNGYFEIFAEGGLIVFSVMTF